MTLNGASVQWLLTLVVPLDFINFYPAALLLGKGGAALLALTYRVFNGSVVRYAGAGG